MKKLGILLSVVVAIALLASPAFGQSRYDRGGLPGRTFAVVAVDADGGFRRGGDNVWLCNGTQAAGGDEVQLQAANDACEAAGGGTVELVGNSFYITKPTGSVDVNDNDAVLWADPYLGDTDNVNPVQQITSSALTTASWDAGAFSNLAVGDMIRCAGGVDDGAVDSLEDNHEEVIATIIRVTGDSPCAGAAWTEATKTLTEAAAFGSTTAGDYIFINAGTNVEAGFYEVATVSSTPFNTCTLVSDPFDGNGDIAGVTIVTVDAVELSEPIDDHSGGTSTDGDDYTGVDVDKMIAAVVQSGYVQFRGAGITPAQIYLATDSNCPPWMIHSTSTKIYAGLENLKLNCKRASQGDKVETNYDQRCPGLLINSYVWDVHIRNVSIEGAKAEDLWVCEPWGFQWAFGWIEHCNGKGIALGSGNAANFYGVKVLQVGEDTSQANGHAVFLREGSHRSTFTGGVFGSDSDWVIYLKTADENRFVGCDIRGTTSVNGGTVYLEDSDLNVFSACNMRASYGWGAYLTNSDQTRFTGCFFRSSNASSEGGIYLNDADYSVISGCDLDVTSTNGSAIGVKLSSTTRNAVITGNRFNSGCADPIELNSTMYPTIQANNGLMPEDECTWVQMVNRSGGNIDRYHVVKHLIDVDGTDSFTETAAAAGDGYFVIGVLAGPGQPVADDGEGFVQTEGYTPLAGVDNDDALVVGSRLSVSDSDAGHFGKAASGQWVVAIATAISNGNGTAVEVPIILIKHPFLEP